MFHRLDITFSALSVWRSVASASALEVLGSGAETGGVTIIDPGAGVSGETRDYSTHGDGGGGSFWHYAMAMTPKASSGNKAYYHNC